MLAGHWGLIRSAAVLSAILVVVALVAIWRSQPHSVNAKIVWTVVVLLIPVFGALGWFLLGRQRRHPPS